MTPFSRFSDYFLMVAKTGSLRKAAEQLFISVSAVHRQIALAEQEMGIQLFERLPNGLKLTLAGEMLYANLLRWQKDFQQTCARFDEIQGLYRGSIHVGMISALTNGFVVETMSEFQRDHPWLNFNVQVHESGKIAEQIRQNDLDFGFILDPNQQHNLDVVAFVEMPIGIVLSAQHPLLVTTHKLVLSDTYDERHIVAQAPLVIHDRVSAIYKKAQFHPQKITTSQDVGVILSLLQHQMGVAILSLLDVYSQVQTGGLIFIPLTESGVQPLTLALCVAPKRQLSKAAQAYMQCLVEYMETMKLMPLLGTGI